MNSASGQLDAELAGEVSEPSEKVMRIVYSDKGPETPLEAAPAAKKGLKAYSGDYWGAFSLERFASAGSLGYTHEDAGGWLSYLQKFHPRNFWYRDGGVRIWAYYEQYDKRGQNRDSTNHNRGVYATGIG